MGRSRQNHGGKRADLNDVYFRSSWEANYARYLNWLKGMGEIKDWEYEPFEFVFETIKRGNRYYKPDFKVIENSGAHTWHEVKGWMDKDSAVKLHRMAKFYPQETVILVDKYAYSNIDKQMRNLIENWE